MVFLFYCNEIGTGFLLIFRNGKNAFETEMVTYKLLIAASKYSAQFDPILHMLSDLLREYRTGCSGVVLSGRFPQFARVVAAVGSAEQTVPALCSLIRVSF